MKKNIFPKDYPELDLSQMRIVLYEASGSLLASMSETASSQAFLYLEKLEVEVHLNNRILDYNGTSLTLEDETTILSKTVIWAAGVRVNSLKGLSQESYGWANRMRVDRLNRIYGYRDVFAIGDISIMETPKYPDGHPQLAQVAIQQAKNLAHNLRKMRTGEKQRDFEYRDRGSLATIGRNLAVADLPFIKLKGFLAWILWSFVHLFAIVGVKNKVFIFLDWSWNYFTYDPSLRLLIRHKPAIAKPAETNMKFHQYETEPPESPIYQ
jgi:NADH dehydrogenase